MNSTDQIKFSIAVFSRLLTTKMDRLERGVQLRKQMHEAIKRGEKPTGYRAKWLKDSALEMVSVLGEIARKFDEKFPDDRASVSDLMDVLATTMGLIKGNVAKKG